MQIVTSKNFQQMGNNMAKSKNNATVYIWDENLEDWKNLENKSDFVNWCLKEYLGKYIEENFGIKGVKRNLDNFNIS